MHVILNSDLFFHIIFLFINLASPIISPKGMNPGPANLTMSITFTCQATGVPLPNITWYFNNTKLVFPNTKYEMNLTIVNSTTVSSNLTVHDVASSDVGLYMCLASNGAGNANVSGVLTMSGNYKMQSHCMYTPSIHMYIQH